MSLRDEIKSAVLEELYEERNVYGYGDESRAADAILALVREALLSDEAVTAGSMGRWKNPEAFRFENYAHRDGWNDDTRKTITAALDAVTGEDDR